jgi:putative addiction module component (TIGR02574 family)
MPDSPFPFDFSRLTISERILLVQQLWDSIPPEAEALPLTDAQKRELDRRWAAFKAGEMPTSTWPEVKKSHPNG